ncbi:MAG: hypothetical protein D6719_04775 [Candidatus Dadabacteria bacterium]|nr:MAG: hypothetical protein D6719_04775 [Candidatus Dadabacteria bacterium]
MAGKKSTYAIVRSKLIIFRLGLALLLSTQVSCAAGAGSKKLQELQKDIDELRSIQAEHTADLVSIRSEIRKLTGRIEEFEYIQSKRVGSDLSALRENVTRLEKLVPPPPIVPVIALESDQALLPKLAPELAEPLGNALKEIRLGNFRGAIPLLQQALDLVDGRAESVYPLFWLGLCYDGVGDLKQALTYYHRTVTEFPKHKRAALALLKEGSVFIRLGDSKAAKLSFQKIIRQYPKSNEARIARERLKDV